MTQKLNAYLDFWKRPTGIKIGGKDVNFMACLRGIEMLDKAEYN